MPPEEEQQGQQGQEEQDQRGASFLDKVKEGADLATVRRLLRHLDGFQDSAAAYQDEKGCNALMLAAGRGDLPLIKLLLLYGVPWNAVDKAGKTAGEYAWDGGQGAAAEELLQAGVRAEMLLAAVQRRQRGSLGPSGTPAGTPAGAGQGTPARSEGYLGQCLRLEKGDDRLLDEDGMAVMMAWERPIMEVHAKAVCSGRANPSVLNIGFGLGLVDEAIQTYQPSSHTIIEAHPQVYQRMLEQGWDKRARVIHARWQDVLGTLAREFDGIFFDTFSEDWEDMRELHSQLRNLLKPGPASVYSFFNGLAATNPFFHSVCCEVAFLELSALGLETTFVPLPVKPPDWEGVRSPYFTLEEYNVPVCQWEEGEGAEEEEERPAPPPAPPSPTRERTD